MNSLIQLLATCEDLLRSVGEIFWANRIKNIIQKAKDNPDGYILEEIFSWYGGMGSFNDLIISIHNYHELSEQDEHKLNDELTKLRNEIYQDSKRNSLTTSSRW